MKTKITLLSLFTFFIFITNVSGQCWQSATAGYQTGAAIKSDGTLWTWGWNAYGQLGLGNTTNRTVPTKVGSATWQMVSMGSESTSSAYAMGIQTNGTLWGWGGNAQGELGIGNNIQQNSPVQVGTATNWKYIYAGYDHTVAIKTDGTLWTWGKNTYGQLGDGTTASRLTPIQVGTATDWKMAASGSSRTIAIKTDGTLWAWGDNDGGFGNGLTANSTTPIQIGTETNWQSISCGMSTTLAIKTNGTLWAWGWNSQGQLGDGTTTSSSVPIQIGTATWQAVFSGFITSFGIKTDGTLWAWGDNEKGSLGDNTVVDKLSPVQVGTANNWTTMGINFTHTFGIKTDGSLFGWGANQISQLGLGNTTEYHVPTSVACYTGCTTAVEGLYPTATFTPACSGSQETITVDAWAGEYSNVNVLANRSYTFRSSVSTDFITITNAAATVIYVSGTTPVTWVSNNAEVIRYFLNTNSSCGTQQTSRTRSITCTNLTCNAPTGLTATDVTTTSGKISWIAASPAPASGYDYYYSDVNTAPTTTASGSVAASVLTKTLTGLTTGVRYYYWVRSKCSATISSSWVSGGSFVPQTNPPCLNGTQFPTATFTPACTGAQETIATNAWGGEYTVVNVLANKVYTFASSVSTDYITIASTDGLTIYATGLTPLVWSSSSVSGTINYFFHTGSGCGIQQTSRTRYITCTEVCGTPSNIAVTNINVSSATVSWTAPATVPGVGYQYYLTTSATPPTASTAATGNINPSAVTASISNLSVSTTYYFWMRSWCQPSNYSNWISGGTFTTASCNAPTNIAITSVTAGSATLSWTPPASLPTFGYEYYYSTSNVAPVAATAPNGSVSSSSTVASLDVFPDSTYYVWMRSRCDSLIYGSWASAGSFTSLSCAPPTGVFIRSVYQGYLVVEFVRPADLPEGYDYYVSTSATAPTLETPPSGDFFMSSVDEGFVFNLLPSTTYHVWMRSNCGDISKSTWIAAGSATTLVCEPPTSVTISNIFSSTAVIQYQGADYIQYYYNTTGVAPTAATEESGWAFSSPTTISGLQPSTTYYLWGRTYCDTNAFSEWIAVAPFTTDIGREVVGSFVNNTTSSTTSFNQSDSVTFKFTLSTPSYWGTTNLYIWAYSYNMTQGNFQESPNNGTFNAPSPASALTANPDGTYSITLNPVSSYFSNQPNIGRLDFVVKNYDGTKSSAPNYAVVVDPIPAPTASNQLFCSQVTVASLVATGSNIKWYTTSTGGTPLASNTPLITGSYYASQTINGSESIARRKIIVTVNTVSVTPTASDICGNEIQALTVTANIDDQVLKVGSGVSINYNYTPYQGYWGGARTQAIYTAAELSALGLQAGSQIRSVGYTLKSGTPIQLNDFTVKAGFTTTTVLVDFIQSPDYTVFTEAAYIPVTGNGDIDYTLAAPLVWDGTSNLLIETCYSNNNNGGGSINNLDVESSPIATKLYKHVKVDNEPNICTRASIYETSVRPNLRIRTAPSDPVMTWSPTEGLYTDAEATMPYVAGDSRSVVYAKPTAYTVYNSTVTASSCTIVNTVTVDAHFTPAPESSKQYFCPGATVADLVVTGNNIKWYDTEGGLLNATDLLQTGVYFVSQTAHGCESEKTAVSVVVNSTPAPVVTDQAFCFEATVSDLVVIGTDIKWFDAANHIVAPSEAIQTGTYYVSQTAHGCESEKAIITVTVNQDTTTSEEATACDSYTWHDVAYTESGDYTYESTNVSGCTNIATLHLTINNSTETSEDVTACDSYEWNGENYTESGDYTYESTNASGCTNMATLHLTINSSTTSEENATACDSYEWNGENYTESGDYTYESTNTSGCTNTATLHLTINNSTETSEDVTACDSYEWNGENYTESGDYTYESTNASGCTNMETLHLIINHTSAPIAFDQTLCHGTTFESLAVSASNIQWYSSTGTPVSGVIPSSGTYGVSQTVDGCESTHTMVNITMLSATPAPAASPQSFCSGNVGDLTVSGSDIRWYHTATGGTAISVNTALETGTYYASQSISGCESTRTAVSVTIQVAMPSAPSPQTFVCGAKRTSLSATGTTIRWYTVSSGGTAMSSGDLLVTGTYYVTQSIDGCQSSRRAVEVIINNIAAPIAYDQTFCYNSTVQQLTATGTDLRWYLGESGGTALLYTTQLSAGTYYVSQKTGTCESPRTAITVTLSGPALPDAPSPQAFNCGARRTSLTATGTGLKWYTSATGGTAMLSSAQLVAGPYYVSQTIDGCEGPRREISVTIIMPTAPTASTQYFCTATTVASLYASGTGIKWYATDTDTTPLASNTPLVTGTYYASQTNSMMCDSARTPVQVIMGGAPMPDAPSPQTLVCGSKRTSLTATGTGLLWYTVPSGGTALSSTAVLVTGTYYVAQTISGCVSARREVSVVITNPAAPAASAQVLCSGATVANLSATGTSLKWYTSGAGGSALAASTPLVSGTYYVSQSAASCESERTAVSVTINTTPMPDAPSPQVFSCNVKRPALVATGTALAWYTAATGGSALSSTAQLSTGTYYVSQTIDGCTSARRSVSVTVNATAPPAVSNQTLCNGKLVSDLMATGTALKWYAAATGGMALSSATPLAQGTYYVSQTMNGCESLRSASNVTLTECAVRAPEVTPTAPAESQDMASAYSIRLFPNPTSSILNIQSDGAFDIEKVIIIDSAGRTVLEQNGNTNEIDVSRFARGVYILRAYSGAQLYQEKFIKE